MESNMRKARIKKGYTLEQVAQKISLTRAALSMQETGKREPSKGVLIALAELYGVTTDYLLGKSANPIVSAEITPAAARDIWFATLTQDDRETIGMYLLLDLSDRLRVNGYILSMLSKSTA